MAKEILYDTEVATMWYHPDKKIIHHEIHKFIYGEEFQNLLLTGTAAMKKYKAEKWLSDDRTNTVVRKADMAWGDENWVPQTIEAGWKYWAIVNPAQVIARTNMKQLARAYAALGVSVKMFTDPDEAIEWLDSF
jgi:hypothetical protein